MFLFFFNKEGTVTYLCPLIHFRIQRLIYTENVTVHRIRREVRGQKLHTEKTDTEFQ